jgi:hypothetical protein
VAHRLRTPVLNTLLSCTGYGRRYLVLSLLHLVIRRVKACPTLIPNLPFMSCTLHNSNDSSSLCRGIKASQVLIYGIVAGGREEI